MTRPRDRADDDSLDSLGAEKMQRLREKAARRGASSGEAPHRSAPQGGAIQNHGEPSCSTTHWSSPTQHYRSASGATMQGDKDYQGATPSWVIRECLARWAEVGATVLDPMCGSGTTLDVCVDGGFKGIGFDLVPRREDITAADARRLPLGDGSVDFVFVDPPYSTHINYSNEVACIGKLDALGPDQGDQYFSAMDAVFKEMRRVLRGGGHLAVFVSDTSRDGEFCPVGFRLFEQLARMFKPAEIISVERGSHKLGVGGGHARAARTRGFLLRGFSYLIVVRKR